MEVHGAGPVPAEVMLVGEAPGAEEERLGQPFIGSSGQELDRMLTEGGFNRADCFTTNVCRLRPPGNDMSEWIARTKKQPTGMVRWKDVWANPAVAVGYQLLEKEIAAVQPSLIIPFGNTSMYALTGKWGITDWRGSQLVGERGLKILPTYHPAAILRQWSWRSTVIADLQRAKRWLESDAPKPVWNMVIKPSFLQVMATLARLEQELNEGFKLLSFDIETKVGHIECVAIAWSELDALCIPFMASGAPTGYWSETEECAIIDALRRVLAHVNARVVGQNLAYDAQYTWRWWHFVPRVWQDTMISHHTAFCELLKRLDYQASLYCKHYVQWKPRAKHDKEGG